MQGGEMGYGRILGFSMIIMAALGAALSMLLRRNGTPVETAVPPAEIPQLGKEGIPEGVAKAIDTEQLRRVAAVAGQRAAKLGADVLPMLKETASRAQGVSLSGVVAASKPLVQEITARLPEIREQLATGSELLAAGGKRAVELEQRLAADLGPAGQKGAETAQKSMETAIEATRQAAGVVKKSVVPQLSSVLEKAQPAASLAIAGGAGRLRETGAGLLETATGGELLRGTADSLGTTAGAVQRRTSKAVRTGATKAASTTGDFIGILFWLGALGLIVMFVFIRDPETRARVWGYVERISRLVVDLSRQSMQR